MEGVGVPCGRGRVGPAADAGSPGTSTSFHPPCVHGGPWSLTTLSITLLREALSMQADGGDPG